MTLRRYRCRFCDRVLLAWLPVPKRPDGAMLLGHICPQHPARVRPVPAADADGGDSIESKNTFVQARGTEDLTPGAGP
jgi:hypothetical protein